jgi:general secretion pathway protein J
VVIDVIHHKGTKAQRGFTLIEVMVALTLLGLVATLLVSGTRLSLDISTRGNARAEAIRTQHTERDLLRSQLQGALPFRYWTETDGKRVEHVGFQGEPDRIWFVSRHGVSDGPHNLPRWVHVTPEQTANGDRKLFIEEHRILSPLNEPETLAAARADLRFCPDVRFEYLGTEGDQPKWLASWTGDERTSPLPAAVRIRCTQTDTASLLVPLDYAEPARQGLVLQ